MAGHYRRKRVMAQCLPNRACAARFTQRLRQLAIGTGLARVDGACQRVNTPMKITDTIQIEREVAQVISLAAQQRSHLAHGMQHVGRSCAFGYTREAALHARPAGDCVRLGQLHARQPGTAPGNAAVPNRGIKQAEAERLHGAAMVARRHAQRRL